MNQGEQISLSDLGFSFSRMSQEFSLPMMERTSEPSSKRSSTLSTPTPMFLDLRKDRVGAEWGGILGDGWSVAWKVHDSQFWGVPQRRRRLCLVADFRGESALEILFERKSLSRDLEQGGEEGEGTPEAVERSSDSANYTLKIRGGCRD